MWCIHSIFSVESVFLGSTTATCENMVGSSAGGFPYITCRESCNILQTLSSNVFKRHDKKLYQAIPSHQAIKKLCQAYKD